MTSCWAAHVRVSDCSLRHLRASCNCETVLNARTMMLTIGSYTNVSEMELKQLRGRTTDTVATIAEDTASSGTCRCLFGPVDPADNASAVASLRAVMDRLYAARWGYDFATGRPLPGGRFEWTEVDHRRSSHTGNDVRDRAVLQQVNAETMTSLDHITMTSSSEILTSYPTTKRRRPAVTSSLRRRRKIARSDDVIRNVAVCPPASQQHRTARRQRHSITGIYTSIYMNFNLLTNFRQLLATYGSKLD